MVRRAPVAGFEVNLHDKILTQTHQTLHATLKTTRLLHALAAAQQRSSRAQAPQERHSSGSGVGAAAAASFAAFAFSEA